MRSGEANAHAVDEQTIRPAGEGPTVCTIRDIIRQLAVEVQFGLVHSHLQGGGRIELPVADRTLYIPGG